MTRLGWAGEYRLMTPRRIFVTGGSGFIGRNTIPVLLRAGHSVVALQRHRGIVPARHPALTIVRGAIERPDAGLLAAISGCDTLLHLAGATTPASSASDPSLDVRVNLLPLLALLEAMKGTGIRRVASLSSGGTIYGPPRFTPTDENHPTIPVSPYGVVKLAVEHLIRLWAVDQGADYVILRAANPYGPHQDGRNGQGVVGTWLTRVLADEPVTVWGDGRVIRDYVYVADVAEALALACGMSGLPSGTYNVSSGIGVSLLEIASAIAEATGRQPRLQFQPGRPYDVPVSILCARRFMSAAGWRAQTGLREGVGRTAAFLQANPPS